MIENAASAWTSTITMPELKSGVSEEANPLLYMFLVLLFVVSFYSPVFKADWSNFISNFVPCKTIVLFSMCILISIAVVFRVFFKRDVAMVIL